MSATQAALMAIGSLRVLLCLPVAVRECLYGDDDGRGVDDADDDVVVGGSGEVVKL